MSASVSTSSEKDAEFWGFDKTEVVGKLINTLDGNISEVVDGLEAEIIRILGRRADVNHILKACAEIDSEIRKKADSRLTRLERYCLQHIFVVPEQVLANPELYRPKKQAAAELVEAEDPLEAPVIECVESFDDAEFQKLDAELAQTKKDLAWEFQRQRCLRADARVLAQTRLEIEKANAYIEGTNLEHFGRLDGGIVAGEELKKYGSDLKRLEAKFGYQQTAGASSSPVGTSGTGTSAVGSSPKRSIATGQRPAGPWSPKKPRTTTHIFG